ncbi:putative glycoside hydrolase subgroup catalytic core protein [Erysiphe necator]|uniref:Putative glycoside hydrolase subgroup catalytic core protein n=1 Tax=Uncinula necator TaxID=52586 RepID=A0A0B1P0H9_UNCNE|nr:putative glycoside hydrolase subgroup catalytic core protein [Erysiphe necator]
MSLVLIWVGLLLLWASQISQCQYQTWCGKVYQKQYPAVIPDGTFEYPVPKPFQMLYLDVKSRYTIFLENDPAVELIVEAAYSNIFGTPITNDSNSILSETLEIGIKCDETGVTLNNTLIPIESKKNIVYFDIKLLLPRLEPYQISVYGKLSNSKKLYSANTEIYVLPARDYGSAVKIDRLYGGSLVQNSFNQYTGWYSVFPHGMFADSKVTIPTTINFTYLRSYADLGFNMILIVPDGAAPEQSYNDQELQIYWDAMDEMNLLNIYSLQFAYQNQTRIETQVNMWKNRNTSFSYHIADEPDGWHHPVENTRLAYDQIKKLDPYHPVQLVLNCQNFHYTEYASGADIILEDAYPIGTSPYHSIIWDTPCNSTYGDCGIDNGNGELIDVANRMDSLYSYQTHIENGGWKPMWSTIQEFEKQDYWNRQPSTKEVINMAMLSINHDAKGVLYWLYTNSNDQGVRGAQMVASILKNHEITRFFLETMAINDLLVEGHSMMDVSAWLLEDQLLIGIVSFSSTSSEQEMKIILPSNIAITGILQQPFGSSYFTLVDNTLSTEGMKAQEVNILIMSVQPSKNKT